MTIGSRIEGARKARGHDKAAPFARYAGVSKQYLDNLEKDRVTKPDPAKLAKIAIALNVTLDWLWCGFGLPGRNQVINESEWDLIEKYRTLSDDGKAATLKFIESKR